MASAVERIERNKLQEQVGRYGKVTSWWEDWEAGLERFGEFGRLMDRWLTQARRELADYDDSMGSYCHWLVDKSDPIVFLS